MPRYDRQEKVIGKISGNVAIIGIGALGTVCADLLARAGINLLLIDRDIVELTNLQRQSLFDEQDINKSKALTAQNKLKLINSAINIKAEPIHLNPNNIELLNNYDVIVDCTDNLKTRFLINKYCKLNNKPWIYGAAIKDKGYVMTITNTPCLECFIKPAQLETCETAGVLNTTTHFIGTIQAQHVFDLLNNKPNKELFHLNKLHLTKLSVSQSQNCQICKNNFKMPEETAKTIKFCGRNLYQIQGKPQKEITYKQDITIFPDGRVLIKAENEAEAQSKYSRFVGN